MTIIALLLGVTTKNIGGTTGTGRGTRTTKSKKYSRLPQFRTTVLLCIWWAT